MRVLIFCSSFQLIQLIFFWVTFLDDTAEKKSLIDDFPADILIRLN